MRFAAILLPINLLIATSHGHNYKENPPNHKRSVFSSERDVYARSLEKRLTVPPMVDYTLNINVTEPVPETNKNKVSISSMADFFLPHVYKKLASVSNYFVTSDMKSMVYFDKDLKNWILHQFEANTSDWEPATGAGIPLARCLCSTYGSGGYVSSLLDVSVYAESTYSTPLEVMLINMENEVIASLGTGLNLGSAIGFTGSVTCDIAKGQFAQPYLYPYYFTVPEGERIRARFIDGKGLETYGEWEKIPSFLRLVSAALLECAIGNTSSVCEPNVPEFLQFADIQGL